MKRRPHRNTCIALGLLALQHSSFAADNGDTVELAEIRVTDNAPADGGAGQGYRVAKVHLGPLGESTLQDTPFSINAVSADLIRNTQAANSTEALKYVPTVYSNTGASQITPYFTMRGFSASTWTYNMAVDGMRSFDIFQPMEDKERIEVMNGAASVLYGVTSPAGMVNYVTKRPTAEPIKEFTLGTYDRQIYGQLDLGGPLAQNPDLAYRLNFGYADQGRTGVDQQSQERFVFSSALDWRIKPDTKLALEAARSRRELDYAQALFMTTAAIGIPTAPDATKNWGAPYTGAIDATTRLGLALESRLNDVFSLRAQIRHSDIERSYVLNRQVWLNKKLDYNWRIDNQQTFHTIVDQYNLFLDAKLSSGPLTHQLTLGATRDDYDSGDNGYRGSTYNTIYPGNLYASPAFRDWSQPPAGASSAEKTAYRTLLLVDRISIGEQWALMLGGTRAEVNDQLTTKTAAGAKSSSGYDQGKFTPTASLSFKPIPALTAYLSYVEALQQGFTAASGTANAGEIFAPFIGKQKEAGLKASLGGISLNTAYFHIEQANQYVDPAANRATQDGRAIHQGWEFSLSGKASEHLTLSGGFTLLDARIAKAAANVGKTPQGTPERMARLYAEYDVPALPGLTLTGGLSYSGKVPWDAANTLYVGAVSTVDAGLRYRNVSYGKDTTWRLNVSNLTDKDYWTTRSGILYLGAPRLLSLSATVAF